jgi:hypothetical protein
MARPDHLDNAPPLPAEDHHVTIVSVQGGQISVLPAKVLVARPHKIALELDNPTQDSRAWTTDHVFTILYTHDDLILRLRAQLTEHIDDARVAVLPLGPAKEGDRRDFRRADMAVQVYAQGIPETDSGKARERQLTTPVDASHPGFALCQSNISGSGISFDFDGRVTKDSLMDVRLVLPGQPNHVIAFIGSIVRAGDPLPSGLQPVAVRFSEFSEAHQDAIIYAVFSQCFAESPIGQDFADFDPLLEE